MVFFGIFGFFSSGILFVCWGRRRTMFRVFTVIGVSAGVGLRFWVSFFRTLLLVLLLVLVLVLVSVLGVAVGGN